MSRVESPFHAIAAEALDDKDTPDVPVPEEVDGSSAPATATTVATSSVDAMDCQEEDSSVKPAPALESNTENGGDGEEHGREENGGEDEIGVEEENGGNEASGKNGGPEQEAEEAPVALEQKVSSEGGGAEVSETVTKKSKKRTNVWTKTTSRKSAKKVKNNGVRGQSDAKDDNVLLKPFHQEDDPLYPILLSKIYKAEKIELSADRLSASGSKGYRMVRATRGVVEGAWYFEISVERLGDTGHTRLGWSTRRGDLQAPVGYDAHSYSYRDLDGCKVHAALREDYGEVYHEKDVIGFYINLPREPGFTRKPEEEVVGYKGQPYIIVADDPLKPLPGSEILFFKNGVCQGVAFKDINDGSYFPGASMYTLPSQDCCKVVFNFGPEFRYPVTGLGDRPLPSPMCQAPGPSGEPRAETFPTNQTEAVEQFTQNGGDKWMAPELGDPMEVEEATEATKKESKPKEVEKVPPAAKKKVKKPPVGNHNPLPSSILPKVGGFLLHPESKKDANLKSFKNDNARVGVESIGLLSQKGGKKNTAGPGFPPPKETQKSKGLLDLRVNTKEKGLPIMKEVQKGKGDLNFKGGQKDRGSPSLTVSKKVSIDTSTETGLALKASKKDVPATGSALKASKRDSHGTGLSLKSSKNDLPGTESIHKPSKKELAGTGSAHHPGKNDLPGTDSIHKPSKKELAGTGSAHHPGKNDSPGTGLVHKLGKKDLLGTGSAHKPGKKDLAGTGSAYKPGKQALAGTGSVHKPGNQDLSGTGSAHKPSKKDLLGAVSAHKPGRKDHPGAVLSHKPSKKDLLGTGSAHKLSRKDLHGRGSVHKPSEFNGPGSLPRGLGSSAFSAGRSWGGIHGAMNVDVVVVETSTPTQAEGPFR